MAQCVLTGKKFMTGHKVSHSNIKTKKRWSANIQEKRVFDIENGRWVRLKLSTRALRTLNKVGVAEMLKRAKG